jgi:hypothetical protein
MSRKPGIVINLKSTQKGYMVLDIETQLTNNRVTKVPPPVRSTVEHLRRPEKQEEDSGPKEQYRMPALAPSEPLTISRVARKIPVSSLWFSEHHVHPIEIQAMPEFFREGSSSELDRGC